MSSEELFGHNKDLKKDLQHTQTDHDRSSDEVHESSFFEDHRSAIPLLMAPKASDQQASSAATFKHHVHFLWMGFVAVILMAVTVVWGAHQREWLANLTISDLQLQSSSRMIALAEAQDELERKNEHQMSVVVKFRGSTEPLRVQTSLEDLGFQFRLQDDFMNQHDLARITPFFDTESTGMIHEASDDTPLGELSFDADQWEYFIEELADLAHRDAQPAHLGWSIRNGWGLQESQPAQELDLRHVERTLELLTLRLKRGVVPDELVVGVKATGLEQTMEEQFELRDAAQALQDMTSTPFVFRSGDKSFWLDLSADPEAITIDGEQFSLNKERIITFLQSIADELYVAPSEVRITGKDEIRYDTYKAVLDGEWTPGKEVWIGELYDQLLAVIDAGLPELAEGEEVIEREISIRLHDIPARVYSELDGIYYDLLGVGYSEYSLGNKPNRVHNILTGLGRIDHSIVGPGEKISFNKMVGSIDYDFKIGYAIFGPVSKPSLGGGICQVSTTFYRGLLETGVPITMRQNHSWDLSYYREGGYGLDATIFPSVGLDVKAVNNHDSHLYLKSVVNPETEEAFVYMYGKSDGREVTLTPQQNIEPFYGAKTLKWTQTVKMPDGNVEEREIVSRYRM